MDIFRIRICRDFSRGSGDGGGGVANDIAYGPFGMLINSGDQSNTKAGQDAANNITAIGNKVAQAGAPTSQEGSQYQGSFDIGNYLKQLFGAQVGMNAAPAGAVAQEQAYQNQGPLAQNLYNQTLQQAQDPSGGFQSALQPELQKAQNQINEYYNSRGLLNSGIAIGSMGEAGVDLAIQNAQNEMAYRQQSLQNANVLSTNISGLNQQNVQNLYGLYGQQQESGQNVANRNLQATETAAGYQAYPSQAALGSYYGGVAAQQALPGQLIGAGGQLGAAFLGGL